MPRKRPPRPWRVKSSLPHPFIDRVKQHLGIISDSEFARELGFTRVHLWRIRAGVRDISDELIICVHDLTGWSIKEIKSMLKRSENA